MTAEEIDRQLELTGEMPKPRPKADLALGYLGVTDPKHNSVFSPSGDFRSATMSKESDDYFWLRVQDHRLEGNMTLADFTPPYFFSGQEAP